MSKAYILAAYRTPACRAYKGKFKSERPDDLAAVAIKGLVERTAIDPMDIEDVILGCAFPEAEAGWDVARVAALKAGLPYQVPGMTINRLCSSGLQSIALAAEKINAGQADCLIAGGTESMTRVPLGGNKFAPNPTMVANYPESFVGMGMTAENVADKYGIEREEMDDFGAASHHKADAAITSGRFIDEIIPVDVEHATLVNGVMQKKAEMVTIDDGVRGVTTAASLAKLKPVFKLKGKVTAGNTSQMTDGAAAVLVVSEAYLKKIGKDPVARFAGFAVSGVPPEIMGIGPVTAIPAALKAAGLKQNDIGLIELNDATGAKLTATLLSEMGKRNERYGMVSMCIGMGMGAAGIFEKL
jgi:acetyl-CoA acyltransferase